MWPCVSVINRAQGAIGVLVREVEGYFFYDCPCIEHIQILEFGNLDVCDALGFPKVIREFVVYLVL